MGYYCIVNKLGALILSLKAEISQNSHFIGSLIPMPA